MENFLRTYALRGFFGGGSSNPGGGGGVPINNQDKTITQNGTYTADEGYTGLGTVSVNVAASGGSEMEEQFIAAIERDSSKPVTELPAGLTKIGDYAFYYYNRLVSISLPNGLTSIGKSAFGNCTELVSISLPNGLTSIGSSAFYYCSNLCLTSLPAGLTSIDGSSFYGCSNLKEITFNSKPSINSTAFKNCYQLLTINVPWAEGEVSGAPWGATNATINYNYTGG
jgi:hypothetical protein